MLDKIFKHSRRFIPYKIKRIIAFFRDKLFGVFSVVIIETSSACNRRCSYCPNSKFDRGLVENNKNLKTELIHKVIDELVDLKWFGQIQFNFYNEPLLDKRLPELVRYASSKLPAASIVIYTNGDFLTQDLYDKLEGSGVTDFVITEHQDNHSDTARKPLKFTQFKKSSRVNVIVRKLEEFYSRGGLIELSNKNKRPKHCLWGVHNIIINCEGEAVLCCDDYFNSVKLGNIDNEKLINIWNKKFYKQLRAELKIGIFRYEICKKCEVGKFSNQNNIVI